MRNWVLNVNYFFKRHNWLVDKKKYAILEQTFQSLEKITFIDLNPFCLSHSSIFHPLSFFYSKKTTLLFLIVQKCKLLSFWYFQIYFLPGRNKYKTVSENLREKMSWPWLEQDGGRVYLLQGHGVAALSRQARKWIFRLHKWKPNAKNWHLSQVASLQKLSCS